MRNMDIPRKPEKAIRWESLEIRNDIFRDFI